MSNGKVVIIYLIVGLIKWFDVILKDVFKTVVALQPIEISKSFPEPFEPFGGDINVTVDLPNYATKTDLKHVTHGTCFALKKNLAEVDKLDIDKSAPVPTDLSKLTYVVKNGVVKEDVYDKLVIKVNNIDTSDSVLKTKYNTDKTEL